MDKTMIINMNDPLVKELWLSVLMTDEFIDDAEDFYQDLKEFPTPWDYHEIGEINRHTERELNYLLGIRFLDSNNKPLLVNWETGKPKGIKYIEITPDRLYLCNSLMRANMNLYDNDDGDYQAGYLYPLFFFLNQVVINKHRLPHKINTYDTNKWLKESGHLRPGFSQIPTI